MKKSIKKEGKIITIKKGNPSLRGRLAANGECYSLYLDYYIRDEYDKNGKRKQIRKQRTVGKVPADFRSDNATLRTALIEQNKEEQKHLKGKGFAIETENPYKDKFDEWLDLYIESYGNEDRRVTIGVVEQFKKFMMKRYRMQMFGAADVTKSVCKLFARELENTHKGEGASTYFQRFHKLMRRAVDDGLFEDDPCSGVSAKVDNSTRNKKEVLTDEEITLLFANIPTNISRELVVAAAVSVRLGFAYCDIKRLTWGDIKVRVIDGENKEALVYHRSKTKIEGGGLLDDDLMSFIDSLGKRGKKQEKMFPAIPTTSEGANKSLKAWVEYAGINKHITWYSLRHSCATNMMIATKDAVSTASVMGHKNPNITLKVYSHALEDSKAAAIRLTRIKPGTAAPQRESNELANMLESLSPEKRELLLQLVGLTK